MGAKSKPNWEVIVSLSDLPSAHVLATRLEAEGVAALVTSDTQLLGEARACDVLVPSELAHRARWLLSQSEFTDEELNYLATGKLDGADE
jgi:hypothetical protein